MRGFFGQINISFPFTERKGVPPTKQFVGGSCFTETTTAIILDPSVSGTSETYDAAQKTWTAIFPNYTLSGIVSCNSLTGTSGTAYPEYNNQITAGYQTNQLQCWCRMTNPVRSAWVFSNTFSSASECASSCANFCGTYVRDHAFFRRGVFGTVGQ